MGTENFQYNEPFTSKKKFVDNISK